MRLSIIIAISLTCALAWAAPASAGTVCDVNGVATFLASDVAGGCPGGSNTPSEINALTVSTNPSGAIVFTDANTAIVDGDGGGGCSVSGKTATCPGTLAYQFDLGAGDDSASVAAVANGGLISTGGAGDDQLNGGPLGDVLDGGGGNDVLNGGLGNDVLTGGDGNDSIDGGGGDDSIDGGLGNDSLRGSDGNDQVHGGDGNDALDGGGGNDALYGGAGDDVEHGGDGNDALDGGAATGCVESGGDDQLLGDGGDDALCGGAGPSAGSDNDAISGGSGQDTAYYLRSGNVRVSLDNIAGDGEPGESDNVTSDVENITSGSGADTLIGNDGRNVLDGGAGSDSLSGLGGNDVLMDSGGDSASNRFDGGEGDDLMSGGAGPDVFAGGDGEDTVTYAARITPVKVTLDGSADDGADGEGDNVGTDVEDVIGGAGNDTLVGNPSDNQLEGGPGDDAISGGDGNDGLIGGSGRDTLDGGAGRDDLEGGGGADLLKTQDGQTDRANCGGGTDAVQADARDDIAGNCENVTLAPPAPVNISSLQITRAGFVVLKLSCPATERNCGGLILVKTIKRLSGRIITAARVGYRFRGGLTRVIRAKIAPNNKPPLRKAKRVKIRASVTNINNDTGQTTSTTKLATVVTRGL